ncbi:unnamed protein product [marine sediment metagenome]|uniref:Uncharacterized protein n=1 Tax=marine sediment metagenome TaxID=412755 RepID=X1FR38_9ZZZZ
MEKKRKREGKQVADAQGPGGLLRIGSMDDYIGRGRYAPTQGDLSQENVRDADGIGESQSDRELRSRGSSDVGNHGIRCKILHRDPGVYPCYACEGGLDFVRCRKIRGVKK